VKVVNHDLLIPYASKETYTLSDGQEPLSDSAT